MLRLLRRQSESLLPFGPAFLRWLTYLVLLPLILSLDETFFGCISLPLRPMDKSGRQQHFIAHLWKHARS